MKNDKMKIISVLVFPFEREFVVRVVRAHDYFTYPQRMKTYAVPYSSRHVVSFFGWCKLLQELNQIRIFETMKSRSKNEAS